MSIPFEHEERYKVSDPEATTQRLVAAGFVLVGIESQTDHWFIPKRIMSPEEQYQWFDYEKGYAVRIREESTLQDARTILTAKQLIVPGDHSTMSNHESPELTVAGVSRVFAAVGEEFGGVLDGLRQRDDNELRSPKPSG